MNPRPLTAILREVSPGGIASLEFHPLSSTSDISLGRDPNCHIVLDSRIHKGVSRQHAKICPVFDQPGEWYILDLNSSNGTYVNGCRIKSDERLFEGDRISLGKRGPQFIFELLDIPPQEDEDFPSPSTIDSHSRPYDHPGSHLRDPLSEKSLNHSDVTLSQLFPILSTGRDLTRKAYLVPGIVTVLFVVLLFLAVGNPAAFNSLLAAYLAAAAYYFVYQLCGKHKPWWLLVGAGLMTAVVLLSPLLDGFIIIFRKVLPGNIPEQPDTSNLPLLLIQMLFGAGLMEELIKALPILSAWAIGRYGRLPYRDILGVNEPLDGILIGTASAVGFTLIETLKVYVPNAVNSVMFQASGIDSQLVGLQLLIPRILGSVAGHMAYTGYLGYFIGLSALIPQKQWRIIAIGYLSASILHALWNTTGFINPIVLAFIGVMSYAFLTAAILKARALSPTRAENFATRFTRIP
ncbi:MAG: PrsW family glutamic-type intramembrane protease [Leptolyngbyaceae bacterium]|nr:PrsW family glutamic-type intramembrane protease [Leptolyngbyaceae bacterium]